LQLWSNSFGSECAIRLKGESNFLAATKESLTQYTDVVEVDYLEDIKYDWDYTLKHWISNRYHHEKDSGKDDEGSFDEQTCVNNSASDKIANNKKKFKCRFWGASKKRT